VRNIVLIVLWSLPWVVMGSMFAAVRYRRLRRKRLMDRPFPRSWEAILAKSLPVYSRLSSDLRDQLHGIINLFLAEKRFEGCEGLVITDEIRVTVAGQACMLLLNRKTKYYPKLSTILIYPRAYVAGKKGLLGGQSDPESVRLGESWQSGPVVLSWDDVKSGAANCEDGLNVAFHEFAHQLDQEDGAADGAPILENRSSYRTWARVCGREYGVLKKRSRKFKKSVMNRYGATNPAEFFAVATETFIEKPRQMQKKHPDLYEEMKAFYKFDPLEWE